MREKTYRVTFYRDADDNYNELWKVIDDGSKVKYLARHVAGPGCWYYVSDPRGYCELDYALHDDVVVIVCDKQGNELKRTCNGDHTAEFPTLERVAHEQWAAYAEKESKGVTVENTHANFLVHWATGTPQGALNKWLLSFKDPNQYGTAALDYDENWVYFMVEHDQPETLAEFDFWGEKHRIERIHCKHKVCGVEFYSYYSGPFYIGAEFDANSNGPMYTQSDAIHMVEAAVKADFPDTLKICYAEAHPSKDETYYAQRWVDTRRAAELLLYKGNQYSPMDLHREFVDRLANHADWPLEFFKNTEQLMAKYPNAVRSYRF